MSGLLNPKMTRPPVVAALASHHADTFAGSSHNHGTLALGSGTIKLIFILCHLSAAGARAVNSVSVAGNAAAEVVPMMTVITGGNDYSFLTVWGVADSVNTSGNVTVVWDSSTAASEIAVFSVDGAGALVTPVDSATANQTVPLSFANLDVSQGGAILAVVGTTGDSGNTTTWSGLTELYDGVTGVGSWTMSAAAMTFDSGATKTPTATASGTPTRGLGAALVYNPL